MENLWSKLSLTEMNAKNGIKCKTYAMNVCLQFKIKFYRVKEWINHHHIKS